MKKYHNFKGKDVTIVICAYKECPYLEESINAVISQTEKTNVIISTSTPNEYILGLADKYGIEVKVNPDGGQVKDYNFALEQCKTPLGMLAHQDDLLDIHYVEKCLNEINRTKKPIIVCTNYLEMHNDIVDEKPSTMIKIKRKLIFPIKNRFMRNFIFAKRLTLLFGDPITHPTVMCVMDEMPTCVFREEYKAAMDWDLWERLSRQKGAFIYVDDVLLYHRMNDENQTVQLFKTSNARYNEEYEIFCRFWPKFIAKMIMKVYSKAERYY